MTFKAITCFGPLNPLFKEDENRAKFGVGRGLKVFNPMGTVASFPIPFDATDHTVETARRPFLGAMCAHLPASERRRPVAQPRPYRVLAHGDGRWGMGMPTGDQTGGGGWLGPTSPPLAIRIFETE